MRLNTRALALAAAAVTAVTFAICAFFVAVAPGTTSAFFSYVLHLDLTALARPLTWGSFCVGLLALTIVAGAVAGLLGWLYNALAHGELTRAAAIRAAEQRG